MKACDSLGFLVLGQFMAFAPTLFPAHFPPGMLDGDNTSALWLQVMGAVNTFIGMGILASVVSMVVVRLLGSLIPEDVLLPLESEELTVVLGIYADSALVTEERQAA